LAVFFLQFLMTDRIALQGSHDSGAACILLSNIHTVVGHETYNPTSWNKRSTEIGWANGHSLISAEFQLICTNQC